MELRVDNRTPMSLLSPISELKLVTNVKYLGLIFEDSLKMQINLQDKREKEAKLKQFSWILFSTNFDRAAAYHLFMAIYESKVSYSSNLITIWDKKTLKWHESFLYRGFKSLLSLTSNVKKEKLMKLALGKTFSEFQETE